MSNRMDSNDYSYGWALKSKILNKVQERRVLDMRSETFQRGFIIFGTRAAARKFIKENCGGCEEDDTKIVKVKLVEVS